jgi:uncharacterized protein
MHTTSTPTDVSAIRDLLQKGTAKIAPLWSLENFVAVNPYLGMADQDFAQAMHFLHTTGRIKATLPLSFYLQAHEEGRLIEADIDAALAKSGNAAYPDAKSLLRALNDSTITANEECYVRTVGDEASEINGKKWGRFMTDRISFWAAAYFDEAQAIWNTRAEKGSLFKAWKTEAEIDYSPEAMGIAGFRAFVGSLPEDHLAAAGQALERLNVPEPVLEYYLSSLLLKMNGWAGYAARIDWDARLEGKDSYAVEEFLAVLLVWECSLLALLPYQGLEAKWRTANLDAERMITHQHRDKGLSRLLVLQEAFDIANQRTILQRINHQPATVLKKTEPKVQAVFCIDVRSELYRRHLEAASEAIETLGFAGFFAFPIKYVPLGYQTGSNQCPVLLTTSHTVKETLANEAEKEKALHQRTLAEHVSRAWKSFKLGAVTCFSFVGPVGLAYLPKLFSDSLGLSRPVKHPDEAGLSQQQQARKDVTLASDDLSGIPLNDRIEMARSALTAMSLTDNFARIVLITGHGSTTVNNPHATGLDCGACGGHTGEANAKVAAAVLNDPAVRQGLKAAGIPVPDGTVFIAALHDTTTDEVRLFHKEKYLATHEADLRELESALRQAGQAARSERAARMNIKAGNINEQVLQRSRDWSQVRPEWGLAGCSSFIVAPRERTRNLNFGAKAFMHSYVWRNDQDFSVLELIMTAPMVVTSWINLQYYASTVDNKKLGSGNKTLHNVVGGTGVLEGFAGDLRVGLPWQSVHDGERYQHEPQRLNVIIEAPIDEMSKILAKHPSVRQLCDNGWIYLFGMNTEGRVAYRYIGDRQWESLS